MDKLVDNSSPNGPTNEAKVRNSPLLKGIMQVLFIIALILLVFAVKFKG